jgi:hypothetical protein
MTKKNLKAEVTVRVLGKDLTKAEAEELYAALGSALGKSNTYQFPYVPYVPNVPYPRPSPFWNTSLIGGVHTTNSAVANHASSAMVEKLVN